MPSSFLCEKWRVKIYNGGQDFTKKTNRKFIQQTVDYENKT